VEKRIKQNEMRFFIFLMGILLCSSCHVVYFPNARNAPMFSGKGEFQGSMSLALTGERNLQTSYALNDHVGVMANAMSVYDHTSYGEIGLGYYHNIKPRMMYFDIFGGYGMGNVDVTIDTPRNMDPAFTYHGPYQKFFIQPGWALKQQMGKTQFLIGAVYRLSLLDISNISAANQSTNAPLIFPTNHPLFHEPAFIGKVVSRQFIFTWQFGLAFTSDHSDNVNAFRTNYILISGGIGLLIDFKRERK